MNTQERQSWPRRTTHLLLILLMRVCRLLLQSCTVESHAKMFYQARVPFPNSSLRFSHACRNLLPGLHRTPITHACRSLTHHCAFPMPAEIFYQASIDPSHTYSVSMSYIQIYMELIQDLLLPQSENLVKPDWLLR